MAKKDEKLDLDLENVDSKTAEAHEDEDSIGSAELVFDGEDPIHVHDTVEDPGHKHVTDPGHTHGESFGGVKGSAIKQHVSEVKEKDQKENSLTEEEKAAKDAEIEAAMLKRNEERKKQAAKDHEELIKKINKVEKTLDKLHKNKNCQSFLQPLHYHKYYLFDKGHAAAGKHRLVAERGILGFQTSQEASDFLKENLEFMKGFVIKKGLHIAKDNNLTRTWMMFKKYATK